MLDSLYIGMSGLEGFSQGLKVVSNNIANLNTAGFKGSTLQFGDTYYQSEQAGQGYAQFGTGLTTLGATVDFRAGELRQTSNPLDAAIDGDGFFITRDDNGNEHLTKSGQFQFDENGFLVSELTGERVAGVDDDGSLTDVSLSGLRTNAPTPTANIELQGILSSTATDFTLDSVKVIDSLGGTHLMKLVFKNTDAGTWSLTLTDDLGATVGSGSVEFADGTPKGGSDSVSFDYTPAGAAAQTIVVKMGEDMSSYASGSSSTVSVATQDGVAPGELTAATLDDTGTLSLTYSNGKTATGTQLAIAQVRAPQLLSEAGSGQFISDDSSNVSIGKAGDGGRGKLTIGSVEGSNVDLAGEFSNLIVMQRGYQASSRVVSTVNDMIQDLFDMKGHS